MERVIFQMCAPDPQGAKGSTEVTGASVTRWFRGYGWFNGSVGAPWRAATDSTEGGTGSSGKQMWCVTYEDGDMEDLDAPTAAALVRFTQQVLARQAAARDAAHAPGALMGRAVLQWARTERKWRQGRVLRFTGRSCAGCAAWRVDFGAGGAGGAQQGQGKAAGKGKAPAKTEGGGGAVVTLSSPDLSVIGLLLVPLDFDTET
eukprot:g155.t1